MSRIAAVIGVAAVLLMSAPAFAVDGVVLINQAAVQAAGGFPFKITQPGSYKLSGNLVVSAVNVDGIDIEANNVTLDLNGFAISGPVTCTLPANTPTISCNESSTGVGVNGTLGPGGNQNLAVRNGSVGGFGTGVFVSGGFNGTGGIVDEVRVFSNAGIGIEMFQGIVRRSTANLNLSDGINAPFSTVTENLCIFNGGFGLEIFGSTFGGNALLNNQKGPLNNPQSGSVSRNDNNCQGSSC